MLNPKTKCVPAATQGGKYWGSTIQLPPNSAGCELEARPHPAGMKMGRHGMAGVVAVGNAVRMTG